jgi:Tfp pilus assembly protein PilV
MNLRYNKSFTLIEVLVSTYILLIGICAMLSLFVYSMASAESAEDRTMATSHAEHVLESMQTMATLSDIISTDWQQWYKDKNLYTLPQEKLKVTFVDPKSDPLSVRVLVQWKRKRVNNTFIDTLITK